MPTPCTRTRVLSWPAWPASHPQRPAAPRAPDPGAGRNPAGPRYLTAGSVRHLLCGRRRTRRRSVAERPLAQFLAVVRGEPAGQVGAGRDDLGGVQPGVHLVVVLLG